MHLAAAFFLWIAAATAALGQERSADAVVWGCSDAGHSNCVWETEAWFSGPTDRYGHAVLGNTPEWGALNVKDASGGGTVVLPLDRVFEDIAPRLADLDGDGAPEVITVESSNAGGGELAIYKLIDGDVRKIAATPPIGRRNRWLAPFAAVDLNGDDLLEIAYVDRPHLAGVLRLWHLKDGQLVQIAAGKGFSNHRIGEDFITGGSRDCGDGAELIVPEFHRSNLMAVRIADGIMVQRSIANRTDRDTVIAALDCKLN